MRILCGFLLVACGVVSAQEYPAFEWNVSASHTSTDLGRTDRETAWGVQSSFATSVHRNVRIATSFATQNHGTLATVEGFPLRLREYQVLAGPEVVFLRGQRIEPFAHALFGAAARHFRSPAAEDIVPLDTVGVDWGFAMAFGGGVDVEATRWLAVRAFQFDYIASKLNRVRPEDTPVENVFAAPGDWQNNRRIGFGIVFRLGSRGQ